MKLFLLGMFVGAGILLWLIARSIGTAEHKPNFFMGDDPYEIPFDPYEPWERQQLTMEDIIWRNYGR
jgi:hypothetical protein